MTPERDRELGAYLVLYALLGVVFFTMAAIVLDIAALRQGRRADRAAADLAATAGVAELDVNDPSTFARACEDAWGYLLANRTEAPGAVSAPTCNSTFPVAPCDATTAARTVSASVGTLEIEITHPVPNAHPLMLAEAQGGDVGQGINGPTDGTSCERLGVRVVRHRTFLFAQIAGAVGGTTDVHSVARALTATSNTEVPAVVSVERTGCDGVTTGPGARLDVRGAGHGGVILVDSDGSTCAPGTFTIRPDPTGRIRALSSGPATGVIHAYALSGSNFPVAYDPADVGAGRLSPQPTPSILRGGRAIIDSRYNCTAANCAAGSDEIDQLEAALGGPGAPAGHIPYPDPSCVVPPATSLTVAGATYVDCPVLEVFGAVTFSGPSLVLAGDVVLRNGGCVAMNSTACGAAGIPAADSVVFVRGSVVKEPASGLFLRQAFVWSGAGFIMFHDGDATVTDSSVDWTAPITGRFQDLLLWSESNGPVQLSEDDFTMLEGTVFAPNAPAVVLVARPGGPSLDVPLQIVSSRVRVEGGDVQLAPTPDRATGAFTRQVRLIR